MTYSEPFGWLVTCRGSGIYPRRASNRCSLPVTPDSWDVYAFRIFAFDLKYVYEGFQGAFYQ